MTLTFETRSRCPLCGWQGRGFVIYTAQVNKHTLRLSHGFGFAAPPRCYECRSPMTHTYSQHPDAESTQKIQQARARRGWVAA